MDDFLIHWLASVIDAPNLVPGEYTPKTNPLDVMTGPSQ